MPRHLMTKATGVCAHARARENSGAPRVTADVDDWTGQLFPADDDTPDTVSPRQRKPPARPWAGEAGRDEFCAAISAWEPYKL